MSSIVVKILKQGETDEIEAAKGELEGAGFVLLCESEAASLGVDASAHDGDQDVYDDAVILVARHE